ncbi:hypothetical protein [Streptomyces sp. NBC_00122]|uniref:hypothetical protein n=1 Tax=Streptomyces sp. NBC_00122 TaxID=2903623 RepID=UPI00386D49D0
MGRTAPVRYARQVYLETAHGALQDVKVRHPQAADVAWTANGEPWPEIAPGDPGGPAALRAVLALRRRGSRVGPLTESGDRVVTSLRGAALALLSVGYALFGLNLWIRLAIAFVVGSATCGPGPDSRIPPPCAPKGRVLATGPGLSVPAPVPAPVAVALSAGAHASRLDGSPLRYNRRDPRLPDLLVCRKGLEETLREEIARLEW